MMLVKMMVSLVHQMVYTVPLFTFFLLQSPALFISHLDLLRFLFLSLFIIPICSEQPSDPKYITRNTISIRVVEIDTVYSIKQLKQGYKADKSNEITREILILNVQSRVLAQRSCLTLLFLSDTLSVSLSLTLFFSLSPSSLSHSNPSAFIINIEFN